MGFASNLLPCLVIAHRANEQHVVLVSLNELNVEPYALGVVPLALPLAFDVLLVIVLSRAEAVDLRLVSWMVDNDLTSWPISDKRRLRLRPLVLRHRVLHRILSRLVPCWACH